jgi:SAM-dependent methyltransferase
MATPTSTQWQLSREAATRYEQVIVPHILGPFAKALVDQAALPAGSTVLDLGCGTGAATRYAAERIGPSGRVIGVDLNGGMLAVAQSLSAANGAPVEWHEANAMQLPLPDESVDRIISAQMLQFVPDKARALAEMRRVLKAGGEVAFSVWRGTVENPYFQAQAEAITQHISAEAAAGLRAGFALADPAVIETLLQEAGLTTIEVSVQQLDLPLPDLEEFVPRHILATPLAAAYNAAPPAAQQAVIDDVIAQLAAFAKNSSVTVPFRTNIARAQK